MKDHSGKSLDNYHMRRADGVLVHFEACTKNSDLVIDGKTLTVNKLGTVSAKESIMASHVLGIDRDEYVKVKLAGELGARLSEMVDSFKGEVITIFSQDPRTEQALDDYKLYVANNFPSMVQYLKFNLVSG